MLFDLQTLSPHTVEQSFDFLCSQETERAVLPRLNDRRSRVSTTEILQ